ncbi:MAG: methylenetetrahydrofolate reductase [NAD(P)H] [Bacteroidetes bacterium]|nr:methylenetetrahydrofolate reductase [NAD(P)H] [Bacteroidota bacterium]
MHITEHITNAKGKTLFSIEILPPLKGKGIENVFKGIDPLMEFQPAFIDVTYHREEFIVKKLADGTEDKISTKKRPGTVAICAAIMNKYKVDTVPHLICGGFSKEETENALIDLNFLGIDNVLVLRGDNAKNESSFIPDKNGNKNALELLEQIQNLNKGKYLDEEIIEATASRFCCGVAGYPEKHYEAVSLDSDMEFLKRKVASGADFIVTQMFFDNQKYFDFVARCKNEGILVPIFPGIKPLTNRKQLTALAKIFSITMPSDLVNAVARCKDEDVKEIGLEWCVQQCIELKKSGVPVLHFYTMGVSEATKYIAHRVF